MSRKQERHESLHSNSWQHNIGKREKYEAQIMRKPVEQIELSEYDLPPVSLTPHNDSKKQKVKSRTKYCRKSGKLHDWGQWQQEKMIVGTKAILTNLWNRYCRFCHKKDCWIPPLKKNSRFLELEYEEVLPPGLFEQYENFPCAKCGKRMKRVGSYDYVCSCTPDLHLAHL